MSAPSPAPEAYRIEKTHLLAAAGLLATTLVILSSYGRRWWCACGSPVPWSFDINGSHNSQHFLDPYSVSHFEHGLFFFIFLWLFRSRLSLSWRLVSAAGIECGWELLENSSFIIDRYRAATISADYVGDSMINSVSDVIFATFGFWVTSQFPSLLSERRRFWTYWIAVVAICELGLIFTVRDSLAINCIMLVHPIEAIRTWQSGG
jgi:hypothetical protein